MAKAKAKEKEKPKPKPRRAARKKNPWERLLDAARSGSLARAKQAVDAGASPSAHALITAAEHGHAPIVQMLLARGANVDEADETRHAGIFTEEPMITRGPTALYDAAKSGDLPKVELLLGLGANPDAHNDDDRGTPLTAGFDSGNLEVLDRLVRASRDAHRKQGVLLRAIAIGRHEAVGILLAREVSLPEAERVESALGQARAIGKEAEVRAILSGRDRRYRPAPEE